MTTQIEFHTGVDDDIAFAGRLLRKAYQRGARVLVRGPGPRLATLDRLLWTQVEREFVPHLRWGQRDPVPAHAARTPIWLVDGDVPVAAPDVLVNLGAGLPASLDGFTRIIEIVGSEGDEAQRGRERWRDYVSRGYAPVHHAAA